MKLLSIILLFFTSNIFATNYYVSKDGSDAAPGTKPLPWRTIAKVNSFTFADGDSVLFKRGDTLRGGLIVPRSGIVIGSYGTGEQPCIWGSKNYKLQSQWTNVAGNIWKVNTVIGASTNTIFPKRDIGNVIFNAPNSCGVKKATYGSMAVQGDFYYSPSGDSLYLFSSSNPGLFYTDIEAGGVQSQYVIRMTGLSNVTITDLDVRYSGNDAIWMTNCNGIIVKNCTVSWAGGWYFDVANVRMGNAIQIWEGNNNIEVKENIINQIYDAGVSPQGNPTGYTQSNISMHHNTISNCYYSYELFIRSPNTFSNITFEYNSCTNAGSQWSQAQRTDSSDAEHIRQAVSTGSYTGIKIRYNTFSGSTVRYAQMDAIAPGMEVNFNTIINNTAVFGRYANANRATLSAWRVASGFDLNSNQTGNKIYILLRRN